MMWMKFLSLFLGLMWIVACKTRKQAAPVTSEVPGVSWIVRYHAGPCFGTCPVYTWYLLDSVQALLQVKANFLEPGWYAADMPVEEVRGLLHELNQPECWMGASADTSEIADLPNRRLVFVTHGVYRSARLAGELVPALSRVSAGINRMIDKAAWTPTRMRPQVLPTQAMDIIVQLTPDMDIDAWILRHASLAIEVKRVLSRRTGHYLIALSPDGPEPNDVLQYIRLDGDVIDAQWDHPLTPRKP